MAETIPPAEPPLPPVRPEPGCDDGEDASVPVALEPAAKHLTSLLPGVAVSDFLRERIPETKWIIPQFVQEESLTLMVSAPNVGKTFLAFDFAAQAVSAGRRVFVVEEEGSRRGLQTRLRRALEAAGVSEPSPTRFRVAFQSRFDLLNGKQMHFLEQALTFYDLIILDSLASLAPGIDENGEEMGRVAESMKQLQAVTHASVLALHHSGKDAWRGGRAHIANARGHSSLHARVDTILELRPIEKAAGVLRFELHCTKQREEDFFAPRACEVLMTGPAAVVTMDKLEPGSRAKPPSAKAQYLNTMMHEVMKVVPVGEENAIAEKAIHDQIRRDVKAVKEAIKLLLLKADLRQLGDFRMYRMKVGPEEGRVPSDSGWGRRAWAERRGED